MTYTCDGQSVGVLIYDAHDRLLMTTCAKNSSGIAPVAGHVRDEHPEYSHVDAAIAETREKVGLTVTAEHLDRVYIQWHPDRCGATVPHTSGGHDWQVFLATEWSGTVTQAEDEASGVRWYTPAEVQALADRTVAYAQGLVSEEEWEASPGLEPMWVDILTLLPKPYMEGAGIFDTVVTVDDTEVMRAVRALYGDTRKDLSGGRVAPGGDFTYLDGSGRRFTLDSEELTVAEEGCTGTVSTATVGLPDPGTEAAHLLLAAMLTAMGMDDYEVVKKA